MKEELKETIKNISFAIAEGSRQLLIRTILDYAGDEYESKEDVIKLAAETNEQLKFRLIEILNYTLENSEEEPIKGTDFLVQELTILGDKNSKMENAIETVIDQMENGKSDKYDIFLHILRTAIGK